MIADGVPEIALRDETFGQILTKPWNRPMLYPIELWVRKSPETASDVGVQFCLVFAPIARGEKRNRPKLGRLAGGEESIRRTHFLPAGNYFLPVALVLPAASASPNPPNGLSKIPVYLACK